LAPNSRGQQRALAHAYRVAQVAPATIDLLEAHGTGTRAGDAVELETYGAIYAEREPERPIALGSIKSNVGHLSSAAGMAGLIKAALALHERTLPPMRHRGRLHAEHRALHDGPLAIAAGARPWPAPAAGQPRRAGVSAFGLGGVNAHVVLEERVAVAERRASPPVPVLDPPNPAPDRASTPLVAQRLRVELVPLTRPPPSLRPSGTLVLLGDPRGRHGSALASALEAAGWSIVRCAAAADDWEASLVSMMTGDIIGAIDAVELDDGGATSPAEAALATTRRAFATARALWPRWDAREAGGRGAGVYVALTAMGGGLGFVAPAGARVGSGGALTGFVKALKQERPALVARALDFDAQDDARFIAATVVGELAAGGDRVEVGYFTRRRLVPVLRPAPLGSQALRGIIGGGEPAVAVEPGAVVVFSGGGRGVVFECARALAERGAVCVISGRTPKPRGDELGVDCDDAAFEVLRRDELARRHKADATLTPVKFAQQWRAVAHTRALARNLAAAGDAVEYRVADVADDDSCAALLAAVRVRHGRIDGIVHGAMVEESRALPDKPLATVDATMRVKVAGLMHLLAHSERDPLRFFVAFGSIAGRLGNRGQADYCAANDAMAKLLAAAAPARPSTRCVTIDWSAWSDVGAAAEVATAERLQRAGVAAIAPAEGRRWFVDELAHGAHGDHELIICPERQAEAWPFAAHVRDGAATTAASEVDDRGQPLVQAAWPLCDALVPAASSSSSSGSPSRSPSPSRSSSPSCARLVVERTFDERRDLFLRQHRLDGVPIVPGAFAVELLAEAARLLVPDGGLRVIRDFAILSPVKLPPGAAPLVHTEARVVERRGGDATVDLVAGGALSQRDRHYRATIELGAPLPPPDLADDALPPHGARQPSYFDRSQTPVALGPLFRLVDWIARHERGCVGQVRPPVERELFAFTGAPHFAVDPLLLDAAFQVAANWDVARTNGFVAIPLGFAALTFHAARPPATPVLVVADVIEERERDVFYDVVAHTNDAVLFALTRLQLRRLERGHA
ncbi:MAG TPA: SDR family NAD(P)-dependent oxidoreductase, partial [Polyangia bacterium]|nr:SDR family NAD(P)-dependent oxidoreductase [Polyangia bacterium]